MASPRYFFFDFMGVPQHTISQVSSQPHAVSTDTIIPHIPHAYLSPFFTARAVFFTAFFTTFLAAFFTILSHLLSFRIGYFYY